MEKGNIGDMIRHLDDLIIQYRSVIERWQNSQNKNNSLLHELVEKQLLAVIEHIVRKHRLNINIRRTSDGLTPLQLASSKHDSQMCKKLKELGAEEVLVEDVSKWNLNGDGKKGVNIVWIDLEMTSLEDPEILECAMIITDKDLNPLKEGKSRCCRCNVHILVPFCQIRG